MEFTGERYMPGLLNAEITYEHWHRYIFTKHFIQNKIVLDIACGEGYGSFYMATYAKEVTGIDISQEAVDHAIVTYEKENLKFMQSDAASINIAAAAFADVVVSFETIEHLDEARQHVFLKEIKRLLKPDGILIISTPDKLLYSDIPQYVNEYHVKEFYSDAFIGFLKNYFLQASFFRQKLFPVSLIWMEDFQSLQPSYLNFAGDRYLLKDQFASDAMYYLGICSDEPVPVKSSSVLIDENATLLKELTAAIIAKDHCIAALRNELADLKKEPGPNNVV